MSLCLSATREHPIRLEGYFAIFFPTIYGTQEGPVSGSPARGHFVRYDLMTPDPEAPLPIGSPMSRSPTPMRW